MSRPNPRRQNPRVKPAKIVTPVRGPVHEYTANIGGDEISFRAPNDAAAKAYAEKRNGKLTGGHGHHKPAEEPAPKKSGKKSSK